MDFSSKLLLPRSDLYMIYLALSVTPQLGLLFCLASSVPVLSLFFYLLRLSKSSNPYKEETPLQKVILLFSIQMPQMYFYAITFILDAFLFYTGCIYTLYYKHLHYQVSVTRTIFPVTSRENSIQKSKPRADLT